MNNKTQPWLANLVWSMGATQALSREHHVCKAIYIVNMKMHDSIPPDTPHIDGDPLVDPPGPADHSRAGRGVGGSVHRVQGLRVLLRPDQGLHRLQPGHGLHHCLLDITEHLHNVYHDVLGPHYKRMVSLLDTMERVEEELSPPP